jgi:hypothetical protein
MLQHASHQVFHVWYNVKSTNWGFRCGVHSRLTFRPPHFCNLSYPAICYNFEAATLVLGIGPFQTEQVSGCPLSQYDLVKRTLERTYPAPFTSPSLKVPSQRVKRLHFYSNISQLTVSYIYLILNCPSSPAFSLKAREMVWQIYLLKSHFIPYLSNVLEYTFST